jgi:hypothetical protein
MFVAFAKISQNDLVFLGLGGMVVKLYGSIGAEKQFKATC